MKKLITSLLLLLYVSLAAQKMKLLSGKMSELKGQVEFNIQFSYDSMIIGTDSNEREYLKVKKREWELKEPGRGLAFVQFWFDDRKELYEPTFIKYFQDYAGVKLNQGNAKYTLIIKTTRTEGGWSIGVLNHPGEIDGEMWIVESADQNKVIAKVGFYDFAGEYASGGDFAMTARIQAAYLLVGKWLGVFLKKKSKKG
jgi:hypothetical protein